MPFCTLALCTPRPRPFTLLRSPLEIGYLYLQWRPWSQNQKPSSSTSAAYAYVYPPSTPTPSNPQKVISPFQAILDYELENKIPTGWINFAIQKGPQDTGAWQRIERGECELDEEWFEAFGRQVSCQEHWREFLGKRGLLGKGEVEEVARVPRKIGRAHV